MVVTSPDSDTQTTNVWVKGNKMREETTTGGQIVITLLDRDWDTRTKYLYYPEQREDLACSVTYTRAKSAIDEAQSILDHNPTITGHKTLNDNFCLVIEYTTATAISKMWIWEQYGFPIRIEMTTSKGKTIIEYSNIEFDDIPDSTFELPEGVIIVDQSLWQGYPSGW